MEHIDLWKTLEWVKYPYSKEKQKRKVGNYQELFFRKRGEVGSK